MRYKLTFVLFSLWSFVNYSQTFFEDFEDLNSLSDWYFINNSDSPGDSWGSGNTNNFGSEMVRTGKFQVKIKNFQTHSQTESFERPVK